MVALMHQIVEPNTSVDNWDMFDVDVQMIQFTFFPLRWIIVKVSRPFDGGLTPTNYFN